MAYAGARFAIAVLEAAAGKSSSSQPEFTYVHLSADAAGSKEAASALGLESNVEYFSFPVQLGKNGVEKILPVGKLSEYESGLVKKAGEDLAGNISKGVAFIETSKL